MNRQIPARTGVAAAVLAGLAVAGCGGGQKSVARPACELLTAEEVSEALGRTVVAVNQVSDEGWSACSYFDLDTMYSFGIDVVWQGGLEQWQLLSEARKMAPQLSEDSAVTEELVRPGPVKGLGDAAWYNELTGSHVLVGDTLVGFRVVLLPEPKKQFRPLAEKVVARLKS